MAITAFALMETGSRTGFLSFVIGMLLIFWSRHSNKKHLVIFLSIFVLVFPFTTIYLRSMSALGLIEKKLVVSSSTLAELYEQTEGVPSVEPSAAYVDGTSLENSLDGGGGGEKPKKLSLWLKRYKSGKKNVSRRSLSDMLMLSYFLERPFTGHGKEAVLKRLEQDSKLLRTGKPLFLSHNSYALMLAEEGAIAVMLFLAFLLHIFIRIIKDPFLGEQLKYLFFIPTFIALITSGFFIHIYRHKIFWIFLSLYAIGLAVQERNARQKTRH